VKLFGRKTKNTEEDVLEYLFGEDYLPGGNKPKAPKKEKPKKAVQLTGDELAEVNRIRRSMVVLFTGATLALAVFAVLLFYPKILYFVGIVKQPAAVAIAKTTDSPNLTVTMDEISTPVWDNLDFDQSVGYSVTNNSTQFAYPKVTISFVDASGKEVGNIVLMPAKEALAPGETVKGMLVWGRDKSKGATKAACSWTAVFKQTDILAEPSTDASGNPPAGATATPTAPATASPTPTTTPPSPSQTPSQTQPPAAPETGAPGIIPIPSIP
jgi:hypothetical protein